MWTPTLEAMQVDRYGLEILDPAECVALLDASSVGRVGVTVGALPTILPVNFVVHRDRVVFRTGAGTKLAAATRNAVVAFEVDQVDETTHTGWSVVVTGVAAEVTDPTELDELGQLPLTRWAPGHDGRVVAISMELVSGRRISEGTPPA